VRYPTALEECYTAARWVGRFGWEHGLDAECLAVAGDCVGGNLATVLTLLSRERGEPNIRLQLLFYPVTDAAFDTASYHQFAEGYHLRRDTMMWCWDQYTRHPSERSEITASPLRASTQQLQGLPPALIITAEADVLRDEGEAYANKLRQAGVRVTAVRFQGTIHDFVTLNALAQTAAARGAISLATAWLREGSRLSPSRHFVLQPTAGGISPTTYFFIGVNRTEKENTHGRIYVKTYLKQSKHCFSTRFLG